MTITAVNGHEVKVDAEGFLTDPQQWDEALGEVFAQRIGLEMTDGHWAAVRFARSDFVATGETPTLRRMATAGGVST
jgi:TusE/DsrC/DsvC family sulfur relay protein